MHNKITNILEAEFAAAMHITIPTFELFIYTFYRWAWYEPKSSWDSSGKRKSKHLLCREGFLFLPCNN
jgi:hypothetical protein